METEQNKLRAWLEEFALLQGEEFPSVSASSEIDFSEESAPEEGQIRLWPALDEPFYGLLLRAGYATWRVLPFSPLSLPAIPAEARVREEPPIHVLEGWNLRTVSTAVVRQSWCAGTIPSEAWFWLQEWLMVVEEGGEMPERFLPQTGPRLKHPLDPRHAYLDREAERADACLGESPASYQTRPQSRAAEDSTEYGRRDDEDPEK